MPQDYQKNRKRRERLDEVETLQTKEFERRERERGEPPRIWIRGNTVGSVRKHIGIRKAPVSQHKLSLGQMKPDVKICYGKQEKKKNNYGSDGSREKHAFIIAVEP